MASFPTANTPFPNHLLDDLMPTLKDTEWRLLCVIVRQTLGWLDGASGRRKASDWLTHSQLKARTGRSSEAVSHAIDVLVKRNLVEVVNDVGEVLLTPNARRRAAGRLYFRLCPRALGTQKNVSNTVAPESEVGVSETEIRKAKTTKETGYKKTPYGGERSEASLPGPIDRSSQPASKALPGNPDVLRFLQAYQQRFRERTPQREPPPIQWGKDGKLVKQLLTLYSYDRLVELLERFFQSESPWLRQRGYSLVAFRTVLPQLLLGESPGRDYRQHQRPGGWAQVGKIVPDQPNVSRHE